MVPLLASPAVPTPVRRTAWAASAALACLLAVLLGAPQAAAQAPPSDAGAGGDAAPAGVEAPIVNEPAAWILVDADTGAVLDGRDTRVPHLPASTIKLFTALVAHQRLPADDGVPISAHAAGMPARRIAVGAGQTWDLEDLLYSMLTVSANDAAVAVAERVGGGSLDGWEVVAAIAAGGLRLEDDPDLSDPAGLDDEFSNEDGSRISPRDLAIVARAVLAEPALMEMVGVDEYRFVGGDGIEHSVDSRNRLLELYPGAIGLKTGLTDRAGRCLVAAATRDGRTMLAVLFDAPDMYLTAATLLDRGFATPVEEQRDADRLPDVVAGATLDPPEAVPGALSRALGPVVAAPAQRLGLDDPRVAAVVVVLGTVPALALRRRLGRLRRVPDHPAA
jgi:D-alanyl-D-alanine carboxypeptidase (penicillin-binding protein 5/6)